MDAPSADAVTTHSLKAQIELFTLGEDATGGPCFFWKNPWSGEREMIAILLWPAHPVEATGDVEELFASLSLETPGDFDHTAKIGERDGYQDAVQDLDIATGGDGEFYGSTIPGRGVDVPTMRDAIIERFDRLHARIKELEDANASMEEAGELALTALHACKANGALSDAQAALVKSAIDAMFDAKAVWHSRVRRNSHARALKDKTDG